VFVLNKRCLEGCSLQQTCIVRNLLRAVAALSLVFATPWAHAATMISTVEQLQNIQNNAAGTYILANDIDASATENWNDGSGFLPIGSALAPFTGTLNGNGHVIADIFISSNLANVGLFGEVGTTGTVKNLKLIGGSVRGPNTPALSPLGALAGRNAGTITNCLATTSVVGLQNDPTGGLVGVNAGSITDSYASGTNNGSMSVADEGGLVGDN
jgi:M26 IgA1-specific Metallo-endopeptidase N-terminal region